MSVDLRQGRWQEVLADVECDALITDPPYSARTHSGHDDGTSLANRGHWRRSDGKLDRCRVRSALPYASWGEGDVWDFVEAWAPRVRGWLVCFSDSVLTSVYREAFEAQGLTGFQPVPVVIRGMTVRLCGDGPSSWAIYANVARPKSLSKWGTLPGAYTCGQGERFHTGGKPLAGMRAIIRDYSRPGDVVCDPCAGGGTTLRACQLEGRIGIGAEIDPETHAKAMERLSQPYMAPAHTPVSGALAQPSLFHLAEPHSA